MKRITSFSIDWYSCGLCSSFDKVHEKTIVYLNKKIIKIEKFNGLGELLTREEYFVLRDNINEFFDFINKIDLSHEWKNDYTVMVCDGWMWEMRLRYSDNTVKLIKGTVEMPAKGRTIKKMIINMLSNECIEMPILFGR